MQQELFGPNVGIFVLGRAILKANPTAQLHFRKDSPSTTTDSEALSGAMYWKSGVVHCAHQTKFGRVGICYDHQNTFALDFFRSFEGKSIEGYSPTEKRSESKLQISYFPTQVLYHMALQGCGESVEFRRIARQYIRQAKNANCDTLYFPEAIFGEESTQKVLQQIAGTQMKIVTLTDVFSLDPSNQPPATGKKREIKISDDFTEFERQRASQILRTKLKD